MIAMTDASPADAVAALGSVRARLDAAARAANRPSPTLIAVTKTVPAERVAPVIAAGHRDFGENRVQEAAAKWQGLRAHAPDMRLHLIGPLQTNKVANAIELFDVLHTVDRPKLAVALSAEMVRQGRRPPCFVQVNTGLEPQKAGIAPAEADAFLARCRTEWNIPVIGLMCIPPVVEEPSPHFAFLREIARRNNLDQLSMGMSDDFEVATLFGSTHVRIGSAIFGARR
jgi:pyridoxal phosphate enzyme (YggS family)